MRRLAVALAATVVIAACTSTASAPSPTPIVTAPATAPPSFAPTARPRATTQPLMRGEVFTMPAELDMVSFLADGGSLIAWIPENRPSSHLDRIRRADPPAGPWRTIFTDDAHFRLQRVSDGRMAITEYRDDGEGAYNETVIVLDLRTGATTTIDRYALSKATFRGGGGAPRRAVGGLLKLGPSTIAWTHLYEMPGGAVEAELRVAPLADPRAPTLIARSTEWIEPVAVDQRSVTYVLGGRERDEVRVRDLTTGADRRLTTFASPTQVSGRSPPAQSGSWIGWLETKPAVPPTRAVPSNVTFQALNIATGEERSADAGGASCWPMTGNAQAFAWSCRSSADPPATLRALDVALWRLVDVVSPGSVDPFGLQAVDSGFVWTDADGTTRQVHLFTPAPGVFGQP